MTEDCIDDRTQSSATRSDLIHSKGDRRPGSYLRLLVGMTGPVIRGRAGRTPLPLMDSQPIIRSPYAAPFER